jgi:hypothetical protein
MKSTLLALAALVALAGPAAAAGPGHCHDDITAVKAALVKAKLNSTDAATVTKALADADALHKGGKEADCEKALVGAKKLVGVKHDHKH